LENRDEETTRILDFLGVDSAKLRTDIVKTNPDSLSKILSNFDEVREALEDSPYQQYVV
jgi:hypothetical protein